MELYCMLTVVDRNREQKFLRLCRELNISVTLTMRGWGTATRSHLQLYDLEPTEKTVFTAPVTAATMKRLIREAKRQLSFDIPGNGIMMYTPIKSVAGKNTLSFFTEGQDTEGTVPSMEFKNELIVVILNEGHSDAVMETARSVGATGGTILHAKGATGDTSRRFFRVSVAHEKDMIYILSSAEKKAEIMRSISSACGAGTPAQAVCFSLPVSGIVGFRHLEEDED